MSVTRRIDSHQHFWQLSRGDYGWLTPSAGKLYRDYLPETLVPLLTRHGIARTVVVQAAPTVAETEYLLTLAQSNDFIAGVVGWVELDQPHGAEQVARLARHRKLVGLRPMIQDMADPRWMLQESLAPALHAAGDRNLVFDALVRPLHLPSLLQFCKRYRQLRIVVDHGAKPDFRKENFADWARHMERLAREPHVRCKLSGLVTEAGNADPTVLAPYVAHLLQVFGPQRMMWGSDWPVCTLVCEYDEWLAATETLLHDLNEAQRDLIFFQVACETYGL